jgi:hypothetical protein
MTITDQELRFWCPRPESVQLWVAALNQKRQAYKLPDFFLIDICMD